MNDLAVAAFVELLGFFSSCETYIHTSPHGHTPGALAGDFLYLPSTRYCVYVSLFFLFVGFYFLWSY